MTAPFPIRKECPPGACICERERLLQDIDADLRVLQLTLQEEKRLVERLENLVDLADLERMQARLHAQLGITLRIAPSLNEVRSMRGIGIVVDEQSGLCRKTRQAIPAAIRRSLEQRPEIAYAILNGNDLLRDA
ncbi:hypothetical protein D3880_00220 [Pseudomonas cavernae]|uniref:Ribosomal protein S3AE n=1 Tax=Pseudomonas cavernae TaxID=2320867 RepID=A0A385YVI0_9PSED|nr:hypothetical protein [Pseudomonas cavernae]AYC30905.1 hypothetical protein D3880_00220 [Pseudomonas cavernae]